MKLKKRIVFIVIPIAVFATLLYILVSKIVEAEKAGTYVEATNDMPYAYTKYRNHVVLEKYTGAEKNVKIPETIDGVSVTEIGDDCFMCNHSIEEVTLGNQVERIGKDAFERCDRLKTVLNGNGVIDIGVGAFDWCTLLEKVEFGSRIERIGNVAFYNCESLREFPPQDDLTEIGEGAFAYTGLEKFQFNENTIIGAKAFYETKWLEDQEKEFLISAGKVLIAYTGKDETVSIPDGIERIAEGSFNRKKRIKVYVPRTVTKIDHAAFTNCDYISIYIPDSVTELGYWNDYNKDETIIEKWSTKHYTIYTTEGSYAQQYAEKFEIPCKVIDPW